MYYMADISCVSGRPENVQNSYWAHFPVGHVARGLLRDCHKDVSPKDWGLTFTTEWSLSRESSKLKLGVCE
jgi:hypothetical protein